MKFLLKKYRFSVFFITLIQLVYGKNGKLHKTKRALLFPASSTLGIFIAIAVPLDLPNRNVFMSYNFEANYNLPFEGAHYIPGPLQRFTEFADEGRNEKVSSEEQSDAGIDHVAKRSPGSLLSRKHVYTILEDKFNAFGYDGRTCLLRLICEVNAAFLGKNNGFLGDLFQIIFGPSTSKEENLHEDYFRAEFNGIFGNCETYTKTCAESLLNIISTPSIM